MTRYFSVLSFICCIAGLFSCQKEFSFEKGDTTPAEGSLWDSTDTCLPYSVNGTFYNGVTPGPDTAYVEIQVNVTKAGSYNIASDFQNGLRFADSGFFGSTGISTVRLKPTGTPIIPVATTFNINFDSTFCSFIVNVQDSTGTGLGGDTTVEVGTGNWQFSTDQGLFTMGTLDTVVLGPDLVFGGSALLMIGYTPAKDSVLHLYVHFPGNTIVPGTYYTQKQGSETFAQALFAFNFVSNGDPIYGALDEAGDGSEVAITISSYDAATHIITGTFSGTAIDEQNEPATIGIEDGSFSATVP